MVCTLNSDWPAVVLMTSFIRILISMSTAQFILSTIFVAATLRALIEGFVHTQNIPNGVFLYWINVTTKCNVIEKTVYITNVSMLDSPQAARKY